MLLETSRRSSLYLVDGRMERRFHDTGATRPVAGRVDDRGVWRGSHNRRVDAMRDEVTFRGADSSRIAAALPAHLTNALVHLKLNPVSTDALAAKCGVKTSTAWNYLVALVEKDPTCIPYARRLVHAPLFDALARIDATGPLGDVKKRLDEGPFRGDVAWRCVENQYAHLRLARWLVA